MIHCMKVNMCKSLIRDGPDESSSFDEKEVLLTQNVANY